ncbi:MAG: hypothetical protein V1701_02680 [Planctomycetota bacterium]
MADKIVCNFDRATCGIPNCPEPQSSCQYYPKSPTKPDEVEKVKTVILGALTRGYATKENEKKELDATLIEAMAKELIPELIEWRDEYTSKAMSKAINLIHESLF